MVTLGQFIELRNKTFAAVNRVNRLENLLKQVNAFQHLIYGEVYEKEDYRIDAAIDDMQDGLEELTALIESEISDTKKAADEYQDELMRGIFDKDELQWGFLFNGRGMK